MVNGEAQQLGVHVAIIVAVGHGGIIARTYTSPADAETHLRRMIELVKELFSDLWKQPAEHVTGRLGERGADTQNFLVRLGGIEQDCFTGHASEGLPFDRRLRGESRSARSQADIDFTLGAAGTPKAYAPWLRVATPAALTFRKSRRD